MYVSRFAAIACTILFGASSPHAGAKTLAAWSQYGERGAVEARLVTDESICPDLIVDGRAVRMTERASSNQAFPVRICAAAVPAGAKRLSGGGIELPVPVRHPRHIVVFGDTGCRIKGAVVQACNDPTAWPFHAIAEQAAQARPDLIVTRDKPRLSGRGRIALTARPSSTLGFAVVRCIGE